MGKITRFLVLMNELANHPRGVGGKDDTDVPSGSVCANWGGPRTIKNLQSSVLHRRRNPETPKQSRGQQTIAE